MKTGSPSVDVPARGTEGDAYTSTRAREEADEEWSQQALKRLAQLPALSGHALAFGWELETVEGESYVVITVGPQRVWRERARIYDWARFNEVKALLKHKYRARFASLTPTDPAAVALLGGEEFATLTLT